MSNAVRTTWVLGVLLALLGTLVVVVRMTADGSTGYATRSGAGTGGAELARSPVSFGISGDTRRPLSPGVTAPLNLEITNRYGSRLWVRHLRVTVRAVDAPRADRAHPCTVRDFAVDQVRTRGATGNRVIRLPAHTTRTLRGLHLSRATWPQVGMLNRKVNQDGCKGAALTLAYTGSGTLARR